MKLPIELRQRNLTLPEGVAQDIRDRAEKLDHFHDKIMRCSITVEGPGKHHHQGKMKVQIDLTIPGAEIVVNRQEGDTLELALRGAFDAAARQLEDHVRKSRGHVKRHE
jgi:ribosome-associated translation inhibitor RaiA